MVQIELEELTKGEVRMLTGHPRGLSARGLYNLDEYDVSDEKITIIAPDNLDTVSPSFVQGFLSGSLNHMGSDSFLERIDLSRLPNFIREDFSIGMQRLVARARRSENSSNPAT